MIILLAFVTEFNEFRLQQNIFNRISLDTIGFVKIQLMKNNWWRLYKEAYAGSIHDFFVVGDFHTKDKLSLTILSARDLNLQIKIPDQYRDIEVLTGSAGLTVVIPIDSFWTPSAVKIKDLLVTLAIAMKKNGYQPAGDLMLYERKLKNDILAKAFGGSFG
ncbi:MAG: hypothetical protein ACK5UP_13185 [Bacteroidota bacterium]|nr:hypothetical protein [Cytophagales bacterium]MCZ8072105.1 hypothetical protein [Cytophagales bacterium]